MLVHPDVYFTTALADHRQAIEQSRRSITGRPDQEQAFAQVQPKRNRRKQLHVAHS